MRRRERRPLAVTLLATHDGATGPAAAANDSTAAAPAAAARAAAPAAAARAAAPAVAAVNSDNDASRHDEEQSTAAVEAATGDDATCPAAAAAAAGVAGPVPQKGGLSHNAMLGRGTGRYGCQRGTDRWG